MKTWSPVFNLLAGLLLVIMGITFVNYDRVITRDFEQDRYNFAVRQATEAMFLSTLSTEDLGMDYKNLQYVSINSSTALQIYDRVMCFNYNLAPFSENFDAVNQSIAACVLAGYDGYYIGETVPVDSEPHNGILVDGYGLKFSPKVPYFLETPTNVYALDTFLNTWMSISKVSPNATPAYNVVSSLPAGFTGEDVTDAVNTQIRATLLNELDSSDNALMENLREFRLFFPDTTTATGVNPIDVPAIFVMTKAPDFATSSRIYSMSTSGYKVVSKVNVIAFTDTRTGRSYYCYEGQLRDEEKTAKSGGISTGTGYGTFEIENYYKSIQEAAAAVSPTTGEHYAPYYDIMARKINKGDITPDF